MKQFVPKVLAIWLASWAIVTLQPCCESILETSQSHHQTQESENHTDHHAVDTTHHNSSHDCRIALENLDDLAAPVTDTFLSRIEPQLNTYIVTTNYEYLALSDKPTVLYEYQYTHPPPGNTQLYLSTLRIRV